MYLYNCCVIRCLNNKNWRDTFNMTIQVTNGCITNTIVGGSFNNNLHKLKVMY